MSTVLITGGEGYLGSLAARKYLSGSTSKVLLWVRGSGESEIEAKRERILRALPGYADRLAVHGGDLTQAEPFRTVPTKEINAILHAAAVIRFSVDAVTARQVNTEGTAKIIELASRCSSLKTFGLLSSIYASGLRPGPIPETRFDAGLGFANHYERSKWESEMLLFEKAPELPWRIFRIATVVADDGSGAVTQQNAVHETLRLFFYGLLPVLPGLPTTRLYFVTGEFVGDAMLRLMQDSEHHGIYHLAHRPLESITLGDLVEIGYEVFTEDEDFRERRVLKPPFTDQEGFELLVQGISPFPGVLSQAVSALAPFARQLYIPKDVENDRLRDAFPEYRAPDPRELVRRMTAHLVRTRWGRSPREARTGP